MHRVSHLSRYVCVECDQRFTRKEHLQRHYATHGPSRQFECKTCHHKFTRSDVLRRHERIHQVVQGASSETQDGNRRSTERKLRASVACDSCARAKLRCDGEFPCDRCQSKSLVCTLNRPHVGIKQRNALSKQINSEQCANDTDTSRCVASSAYPSPVPTSPFASQLTAASIHHLSALDGTSSSLEQAAAISTSCLPMAGAVGLPLQPMGEELDFVGLGGFGSGTHFPEELSFPFQVPSHDAEDGFYHLPWPSEEDIVDALLEQSPNSSNKQEVPAKTPTAVGGASATNPYANCPFEYRFKRGPTVNSHHICEFLHDRSCWRQVDRAHEIPNTTYAAILNIGDSFRDTIAARVYGMLYKLLDRNEFTRIPHLFPPIKTIQSLFVACHDSFLPIYPIIDPAMFSESSWDATNPYEDVGIFLSATLVLGCLVTPVEKVRLFSVELGYLIRLSITEGAIQDETRLTDKWVLSAWVMITVFSAWSGIKRHMELAEAYKGILSAFFLRRGFYRFNPPSSLARCEQLLGSWSNWKEKERNLRLCQIWFIIDHEISLLYCVQPSISFTKMQCPMPVSDELFLLRDEEKWVELSTQWADEGHPTTSLHPPSLAKLYHLFRRPEFLHLNLYVTPLQLRLLLCALQSQVSQYSERFRFIPLEEESSSSLAWITANDSLQLHQREELENMLLKWSILAERVFATQLSSELKVTCLLTAQLVWLELYVSFDDVQLIAGKAGYETGRRYLAHLQHWVQSSAARKAIAHAANVMRILQLSDDESRRPVWWPVALSRAALIMWCYIVGLYLCTGHTAGVDDETLRRTASISLNDPSNEFNPQGRILQPGEGIPCIEDSHKNLLPLHEIPALFDFFIQVLEDSKGPDTPILQSSCQFLQDIKSCGIPYSLAQKPCSTNGVA